MSDKILIKNGYLVNPGTNREGFADIRISNGKVEKINEKYKTTMVIVTHNNSIKNMVHKVIYLKDGLVKTEYENEVRIPASELEDL